MSEKLLSPCIISVPASLHTNWSDIFLPKEERRKALAREERVGWGNNSIVVTGGEYTHSPVCKRLAEGKV